MINVLATKFNQVDASIADTSVSNRRAPNQTFASFKTTANSCFQSSKLACSAIVQVNTALMMLGHVDPSQIDTFKTAVSAQFGTNAIGILESATVAPAFPTTPEPIAPIAPSTPTAPDIEPTIDVEVKVADATVTDFPDRAYSARVTRYRHRNATQQNVTR